MPRTTLNLDPSVLEELRARAEREGKSMGQVSSELLAAGLDRSEPASAGLAPLRWVSRDLGRPTVDLDDKEAVWAILDAEQRERHG